LQPVALVASLCAADQWSNGASSEAVMVLQRVESVKFCGRDSIVHVELRAMRISFVFVALAVTMCVIISHRCILTHTPFALLYFAL
jgi:hypothetical protein